MSNFNLPFSAKLVLGAGFVFAVAALPNTASASLTFYTNQGTFQSDLTTGGNGMVGFEDFEEARLSDGEILGIDDPLNSSTSNAIFSPGEIDALLNVQANIGGSDSSVMSAHGTDGLAAVNNQFGYPTDWVVANFFVDALDMSFSGPVFGVGGNLISALSATTFKIDVYGAGNTFLGTTNVSVSTSSGFWGVTSTDSISRINLFSIEGDAEGMDNVEMWAGAPVPEPATCLLLGTGLVALLKRRKK